MVAVMSESPSNLLWAREGWTKVASSLGEGTRSYLLLSCYQSPKALKTLEVGDAGGGKFTAASVAVVA